MAGITPHSILDQNWCAVFCEGRKTKEPGEKTSEQGREPTTNLTHMFVI